MTTNPDRSGDPVQVVEDFFAALTDLDVDRAVAYLDPEIVWQNTGLPTLRGLPNVTRALRFANRPACRFEAVMHHVVGDDNTVLADRTDLLTVGPVRSRFWVYGTFEVRDGRITLWRDRYNWGTVALGTVTATARTVFERLRRG